MRLHKNFSSIGWIMIQEIDWKYFDKKLEYELLHPSGQIMSVVLTGAELKKTLRGRNEVIFGAIAVRKAS